MAKLNVETHNADGSINVASDEMIIDVNVQRRIGQEACEALTQCFAGGDEYQGRNIASQLCRMVDFMLPYQQDQLSTHEADKVILEENKNKATFDEEMEDLDRKIDEKQPTSISCSCCATSRAKTFSPRRALNMSRKKQADASQQALQQPQLSLPNASNNNKGRRKLPHHFFSQR